MLYPPMCIKSCRQYIITTLVKVQLLLTPCVCLVFPSLTQLVCALKGTKPHYRSCNSQLRSPASHVCTCVYPEQHELPLPLPHFYPSHSHLSLFSISSIPSCPYHSVPSASPLLALPRQGGWHWRLPPSPPTPYPLPLSLPPAPLIPFSCPPPRP